MQVIPDDERDRSILLEALNPHKNLWPGVFAFLGLLAFVYKMTELFVR